MTGTVGAVDAKDFAEVAKTRAAMLRESVDDPREPVAQVLDDDAGGVPVRIYLPAGATGSILFVHGGGFVYGEPDTHDAHARRMAVRTGRAVCFVHYRRAPEAPYPAAVEDVLVVSDWWHDRLDSLGLDPAQQVALGDSAGANLAFVAALHHRERYQRLVLVYPFLDPGLGSYERENDCEQLSLERSAWFWRLYAPDQARWREPDLDPLTVSSYAGLPPTLIQLAEKDVLVSTGRLLADRLRVSGVEVEVREYPGVHHGFWRRFDNDQSEPAQADLAAWLG